MAKYRLGRINEEMRKEISDIIRNDINDHRLTAMVSVTKVDVTNDFKYAKVFVSVFGSEESQKESLQALKSATGLIRREVGHRVKLRITPEIIIELDESIKQGMHINSILADLKEKK
ncbi:30S ribosome-binding factor RbfA [Clostridium grantii]|uniref:Ribosome-binding factor A n=1 Tax=Clostridium grantii DSM 8605 TaxID=1121316 RepID=A0A1M5QXB6_9CLOT|nr:30S ribosome-binding factor RbfA [Clostridium grantii]SHH18526.1 ribosome-binding factor A [Clostridium grantii DSM 8605]